MSKAIITASLLADIADAIRAKTGDTASMTPSEMAEEIANISTGTTPTGTKQISITANGTTTEDVTNYANAEITVNVPGIESGTITGNTATFNIPVSALHSHVYIWADTIKSDDDLSGAPHGGHKLIGFFADGNTGFYYLESTNSAGTALQGAVGGIGRWGGNTVWTNRVEFTNTLIKLININGIGSGKVLIEDMTYNWVAW